MKKDIRLLAGLLVLLAGLFIVADSQSLKPVLFKLKDIKDVSNTAATDGQVLTYVSATSLWTPASAAAALANIADTTNGVEITGASSDTVTITHDGTNATIATSDGKILFDSSATAAPAGIELSDDDTNYVTLISQEMASDFTITLPAAVAGAANYVLNSTGNNATLQFSNVNSIVTKSMVLKVMAEETVVTSGDGKMYFTIPVELNGMNLVSVGAHVYTADTGADHITVDIYNATDSQDMLSAGMQIEDGEKDTATSANPGTINTALDDVATGDEIRIDVTTYAGSSAKGLEIRLGFRLP